MRADVHLVRGDAQIRGDGRGQHGADVHAVDLEGEEGDAEDGEEDKVDSALLVIFNESVGGDRSYFRRSGPSSACQSLTIPSFAVADTSLSTFFWSSL